MVVYEAVYEDLAWANGLTRVEELHAASLAQHRFSLGLFQTPSQACQACEINYVDKCEGRHALRAIHWYPSDQGESTQDLGFVMYHVVERQVI